MLNCGGSIDIVDEFKREAEYDHSDDSIKFVVLDSHRPYNLANVRESNQKACIHYIYSVYHVRC